MQKITSGISDTQPNKIMKSNNMAQYLVNVNKKNITDPFTQKIETIWAYDYVEVDKIVTAKKVADKISECGIITSDTIVGTFADNTKEYITQRLDKGLK
ncbi:MAG: hypothetical protein EPN85_09825 [Bacteroidetes bacterium]|nr:MAG: hypothetical protein EPN85_09825 [Bacteroidota bacterium]